MASAAYLRAASAYMYAALTAELQSLDEYTAYTPVSGAGKSRRECVQNLIERKIIC